MRTLRPLLPGVALLLALSAMNARAQQGRINGTVIDQQASTPIAAAQIRVQGTNIGATTDDQGRFVLNNVPAGEVTVVAQRLGYVMGQAKTTVSSGTAATVSFQLTRATLALDEVVVVGYGSTDRRNLTSAIEQVNGDEIAKRPVPNLTQGLQGVLPNVNIRPMDGKPIQAPVINIRGMTSIGTGGSALVLIDGVEGDPSSINPNDVESITVLKDASSAAVYGARGAFGVLLITTKRPKAGQFAINYGASYGTKQPTAIPDLVSDGYTYAKNFAQAYQDWQGFAPQNFNKTMVFSQALLDSLKARSQAGVAPGIAVGPDGNYVYYGSTDWMDLLYKKNPAVMDQNFSVSRASESTQFMVSGRYLGQDGLFRYNSDDFTQKNLRANGAVKLASWVNVRSSFDYSNRKYHNPLNVGEGGGVWRNLEDNTQPLSALYNPDGTLTASAAYSVGDLAYGKNGIDYKRDIYRSTTEAVGDFFDKHFQLTSDFTFQKQIDNNQQRRVPVPYSTRPGTIAWLGAATNDLQNDDQNTSYIATNLYGEYNTTLRTKHSIRAMGGVNYEDHTWDRLLAQRNGLIFPDATDLNLALGTSSTITGGYERWNVLGTFTRLNYSYDDRYLLEFTGRYDGSSKFPQDQALRVLPIGVGRVARVAGAILEGVAEARQRSATARVVGHDGQRQRRRLSVPADVRHLAVGHDRERHQAEPDARTGGAAERPDLGNRGDDERRSRLRPVQQPAHLYRRRLSAKDDEHVHARRHAARGVRRRAAQGQLCRPGDDRMGALAGMAGRVSARRQARDLRHPRRRLRQSREDPEVQQSERTAQ